MKCLDCPDFKGVHPEKEVVSMGYCLSDSTPGTINPLANTQCKNHPDHKRQLSSKTFNNKLGVVKG